MTPNYLYLPDDIVGATPEIELTDNVIEESPDQLQSLTDQSGEGLVHEDFGTPV